MILPLLAALAFSVADPIYTSATVDSAGQLHIVLNSGKEILPAKLKGQVAFDSPALSPDGRTVGWLALYPDPTVTYYKGATLAGALVIYRAGRVLHTFTAAQVFWDWQFQDGGKLVAYSTGPTHGGAAECVLADVDSGKIVERWAVPPGPEGQEAEPPVWARTLHR
jgi:hypothetical protein